MASFLYQYFATVEFVEYRGRFQYPADTNFIKLLRNLKKLTYLSLYIKGLKIDDLKFGLFLLFLPSLYMFCTQQTKLWVSWL